MIGATLPSHVGLVLNNRMQLPISLFIGLRYSQSRKGNAFISFITLFSVAGIFLGVMALTIVSSVMNGFEGELNDAFKRSSLNGWRHDGLPWEQM